MAGEITRPLVVQHNGEQDAVAPLHAQCLASLISLAADIRAGLTSLAADARRIADRLDPSPGDKVGTDYVGRKLDVTPTWVADMVRNGQIPKQAIVPGTGNGKPWKFFRDRIDAWIKSR